MNLYDAYTLGIFFCGFYLTKFGISLPVQIDGLDVTSDQFDRFASHFSVELRDIRQDIAKAQSYDEDYPYALNPLKIKPLIWVVLDQKRTLIAPIPTYLFRRFTEGVYYEICNAPNFATAFGESFQKYVGEVLDVVGTSKFRILAEQEYRVGRDRKDSVDWIVGDERAELFIECKTKRLRFAAKIALATTETLDEDLGKMAEFIVQTYKALQDAKLGLYPHWNLNDRPVYPIIVTLEEWYIFGDRILPAIEEQVRLGLTGAGIDLHILDEHPFSICSLADFEEAIQIMAEVGIDRFMKRKTDNEHRRWHFHSVAIEGFRAEQNRIRMSLFPDEIGKIHPRLNQTSDPIQF